MLLLSLQVACPLPSLFCVGIPFVPNGSEANLALRQRLTKLGDAVFSVATLIHG